VLSLARTGQIPGHPIGNRKRRIWRFRLKELAAWMDSNKELESEPHRGCADGSNSADGNCGEEERTTTDVPSMYHGSMHKTSKVLKNMVGTRRLELLTSTVSR
jgi:hypothetical protein